MSSRLRGKNTSLPCTWLCSLASAGCVLHARLHFVPRAPAFPIYMVKAALGKAKEPKGLGDKEGHNPPESFTSWH